MGKRADASFDRYRAHRRQCAKCKTAESHDDPRLCPLGARMAVAWLDQEVRSGNPHYRRVEDKPATPEVP